MQQSCRPFGGPPPEALCEEKEVDLKGGSCDDYKRHTAKFKTYNLLTLKRVLSLKLLR